MRLISVARACACALLMMAAPAAAQLTGVRANPALGQAVQPQPCSWTDATGYQNLCSYKTPLPDMAPPASSSATTSVSGSATPVQLLAANPLRSGASILNDSTAILYVLLGSGAVSSSNYTYALAAATTVGGVIEVPKDWTGVVMGVWASAAGAARVTERSR